MPISNHHVLMPDVEARINDIEQTAVRLEQYNAEMYTITTRLDVANEQISVLYDEIVDEVLRRVIEIIENKSNWIYSPPEDEFDSDLEGLF